jgi:hypothetical protein
LRKEVIVWTGSVVNEESQARGAVEVKADGSQLFGILQDL